MLYYAVAFAVVTVLFRQIQPGIALMWLAVESAAAFLLAVIAVVEKLFAQAIELRAESELTV